MCQRWRLDGAGAELAVRRLPLRALLDALRPQLRQASAFRTRRKKRRPRWDAAYAALHAAPPGHRVLAPAFQVLADLLREAARDISPAQWKQAAKELALATLKNAPALLHAAHQARRLA